jgi:hypothetical protein
MGEERWAEKKIKIFENLSGIRHRYLMKKVYRESRLAEMERESREEYELKGVQV